MRRLTPQRIIRGVWWRVRNALTLWRLRLLCPRLTLGKGVRITGRLRVSGPGRVIIGDHCVLYCSTGQPNVFLTFAPDAVIEIGDWCRVNGAHMQAASSVRFGSNCRVADAHLVDTDFHSVDPDARRPSSLCDGHGGGPKGKPIVIGDDVWICGRAAVLKGVHIGEGAVVGYRAVVRRDVPARAVVIGNPAEVVKRLDRAGPRQVAEPEST